MLADAGVLVHVFDGWEAAGKAWDPGTIHREQSGSLIFAAQHVAGLPLPLINSGGSGGIIFRPYITKVNCGKAKDSAGTCDLGAWCPAISDPMPPEVSWGDPNDSTCGPQGSGPWRPQDFGAYLLRVTAWQERWQQLAYNEIIIDAVHWRAHLPDVVQAVFGRRDFYDQFIAHYGLDEARVPFLTIDINGWEQPFDEA